MSKLIEVFSGPDRRVVPRLWPAARLAEEPDVGQRLEAALPAEPLRGGRSGAAGFAATKAGG